MTASLAVHWTLIELKQRLGIDYQLSLVDFKDNAQKAPEYLKLNPKGQVPCLVVDDQGGQRPYAITESTAILLFLAERHPEADLAPSISSSKDRAAYLETMVFVANTLLSSFRNYIYASKDGGEACAEGARSLALTKLVAGFDLLNEQLATREYLAGGQLTVADFLGVMVTTWTRRHPRPAMKLENIRRWVEKVITLESWERLCEAEGITKEQRELFLNPPGTNA